MEKITVTKVFVEATPGSQIDRCLEESIVLALTERRNVVLVHNGKKYEIKPDEIIKIISES